MPRDPLAGLQKQVVQLPFVDGLANNFAAQFRPEPKDAMLTIENADLTSIGKFSNRGGFVSLSNQRIGPEGGSSVITSTQMRLFQRQGELGCIANTQVALGSGAGWAGAGDTVFSYTKNIPADAAIGAWKGHGKIPRPTLGCLGNLTPDPLIHTSDCAVSGNFMIVAWHTATGGNTPGGPHGDVFFRVVDITTNTTVIDTTQFPTPPGFYASGFTDTGGSGFGFQAKLQCLAMGNRLYIFLICRNLAFVGQNDVIGAYVDMSVANPVMSSFITLFTAAKTFSMCTNGTNIFMAATLAASPNQARIRTYDSSLIVTNSGNAHLFGSAIDDLNCDAAFGVLAITYLNADIQTVDIWNASTLANVATLGTMCPIITPFSFTLRTPDVVLLSSASVETVVFGAIPAFNSGVFWNRGDVVAGAMTPTGKTGGVPFIAPGVRNIGRLFTINGRVYFPAVKCDFDPALGSGVDYGYFLLEIDSSVSQGATDLYRLPMVAANWATDLSAPVFDTNNVGASGFAAVEMFLPRGCVAGNVYYLTTRRGSALGNRPTPLFTNYQMEVIKLDFADAYRWASRAFGSLTVFAGGAMFATDGRRTFEAGILCRPRILSIVGGGTGGSLVNGNQYFFRAVYTWLDAAGQRYFSAPSYAQRAGDVFSFTPGTPILQIVLTVTAPPCFSGMCSGADYFENSMEVWIYMTNSNTPGIYFLVAQMNTNSSQVGAFSPVNGNATASVGISAEPPSTADQLYVQGGELENSAAPTCRVLEAHRDRLFAISSYDNNVYYTKPATGGRGIEWAQQTQNFALPEPGLGLASNETCLMIFTNRGVYAIEGYGPSVTGQPVQAFGALQLLSNQMGLYEVNSCKTTPIGVIFRTNKGWWLVDRTLSMSYIGDGIDGMITAADKTIAVNVDQRRAVIRIMMTLGASFSDYKQFNYWYDSKRWSVDKSALSYHYKDAMVLGDDYFMIDPFDVVASSGPNYGITWLDGQYDTVGHGPSVSTGWITVSNMAMLKRIWRVVATVENLCLDEADSPSLSMTVYADWVETPIVTGTWTSDVVGQGVQTVRLHLPIQKMKAIKIAVREVPFSDVERLTNNVPGYNLIGVGFEVGVKGRMSLEGTAKSA